MCGTSVPLLRVILLAPPNTSFFFHYEAIGQLQGVGCEPPALPDVPIQRILSANCKLNLHLPSASCPSKAQILNFDTYNDQGKHVK